jgi:sulfate adenylyltransferase subunit 2
LLSAKQWRGCVAENTRTESEREIMSQLSHLDALEAEAIYIIREVAAECEKPVMLYSIGKDSSVMLHLALKAFYPEKPPFPFLHVNTTWKFHEMIRFRDEQAEKYGLEMIEWINKEGVEAGHQSV